MIFSFKKHISILLFSLFFIFSVVFCNVANASTFTDTVSGIINFISTKIIGQIRNDFCKNYILSLSTGEWKDGELRSNLGKRFCTSYSVPTDLTAKINKTTLQNLNGNSGISNTDSPNTSPINNPEPDIYVTNVGVGGGDLNASQIITFTNNARKSNDTSLIDLKYNSVLSNIAEVRVKDMFAKQYFEHNSPTGDNASKEAVKNGYSYITIGENIALGNFNGSEGIVNAWMDSPGHRANILNKNYTEIGVYAMQGIYNGQTVWIATQIFGKPMSGCTSPDTVLKDKIAQYKYSADGILNNIKTIDTELKTISATDTQTYNSKVAERNTLAGLYNNLASEIKARVADYNKEVSAYNTCIKTI